MNETQQQADVFETIRGATGSHMALAELCESKGFVVDMDSENNERSEIKISGAWHTDGSDIVVGEIIGDAEAVIK